MRWRYIISLLILVSGLFVLELRTIAQTTTATPSAVATATTSSSASSVSAIATALATAIATSGGATPTPGQAQAAPIASDIPPLPDRAQTDTPSERIQATLNAMRSQTAQRRVRTFEAGTVKPGQGLSNMSAALAATIPPRHTAESVMAGQETMGEFLAYNALHAALNQTVLDLATVVAANNPFDPLFGTVRASSTQPTTLPAVQPTTLPATKTTIPTKRKLQVTDQQLFDVQSFQEYTDELLMDAFHTLTSTP